MNYKKNYNTISEAVNWFNIIKEKKKADFIQFYIEGFYPSISEKTFEKAIEFAKKYTNINEQEIYIIKHGRKNIIANNDDIWVKNTSIIKMYLREVLIQLRLRT